ncbi:nucleotide sugar dehydrogenase [Bacteroides xylanisolvens]|nr:nucleotide sugar dehydrogenase [Bacteroides xylanisolvens]
MSGYVVKQMVKEMIRNHVDTRHAKIYLLGMTFKEDCPDVRNSRAVDIFHGLKEMGFDPIAVDPAADHRLLESIRGQPWGRAVS